MTPEEIIDLKNCFISDLMYQALSDNCNSCIPCSLCPIRKYYNTHDWEWKKDIFHCNDVVVKQREEFKQWMSEQW